MPCGGTAKRVDVAASLLLVAGTLLGRLGGKYGELRLAAIAFDRHPIDALNPLERPTDRIWLNARGFQRGADIAAHRHLRHRDQQAAIGHVMAGGDLAAEAVLADAGRPERVLGADLPRGWLAGLNLPRA